LVRDTLMFTPIRQSRPGFIRMNRGRKISLSAAVFVLICFFLPWVQVSCLGAKGSASGLNLALDGDRSLWLIPALMVAVLLLGLIRSIWERYPAAFALAGIVGGGFAAYLMLHRHSQSESSTRLLIAQWTPWFWFAILASVLVA